MNIIIYGGNGWIGKQFVDILNKNDVNFNIGKSRVDDTDALLLEIEEYKPTHVISFIGRTHGCIEGVQYNTIDYLEHKDTLYENIRDNLYAPLCLAKICTDLNIHYTYLGTGCIFDSDDSNQQYTEDSKPNFYGSNYSIVKGFTDQIMHQYNVLNLRIRMPICNEKNSRNFITKITSYEKICSLPNSMSVLPDLLPYILDLMQFKYIGTLNFTNPGYITHNEILDMYTKIVDPTFTYNNIDKSELYKLIHSQRSNNVLNTDKLQKLFPEVSSIHKAVHDCLSTYK